MNYLRAHWRGEQSIVRAFWINLVALRIGVFVAQQWAERMGLIHGDIPVGFVVLWILLFHVCLLSWQLVGVIRSAENDFARRGTMGLVWAVQLAAVLFVIHTALSVFEVSLILHQDSEDQDRWDAMVEQREKRYKVSLVPDGNTVLIKGVLELGAAQRVGDILEAQPYVRNVELNSVGGNIYEARALAQLFQKHGVATHVDSLCASACTTAYIGGVVRTVAPTARLGFHQYSVNADYTIIATSPEKEQLRDTMFYKRAGISTAFIESVFSTSADSMWWPTQPALISAGVVHTVKNE